MSKNLVVAGALAGVAALGWLGFTQPSNAGWGPPFACGAGQKTQTIQWDPTIATPGEPEAAITGVAAKPVDTEKEFSIEELKSAKPLFVYYYVEGMDQTNGRDDPSLKFAMQFEFGGLGEKVVTELNEQWRAKKVGLDLDADRKDAKNQARIEFWSYTGVKMGDITCKESGRLNPGPLKAELKRYRVKNADLCAKEIKRIEDAAKARAKAEKEAALKESAAK